MTTILDAMADPQLFAAWFAGKASWSPWKAALRALFALEMSDEDLEIYRRHTHRTSAPTNRAREGWFVVGRRGGKSRIAALLAVYMACFRDHRKLLAPGEVGTVMLIASDRRQARVLLRYIEGFIEAVPMLKAMVLRRTRETIELSNRIVIEVHTANFRAVRGYTLVGVVADEAAFWRTDDAAANPDTEIIAGLRPGLATIPDALLLVISSPYARRGALWTAYSRHFGNDDDPILVWQASSAAMNSTLDQEIIRDAYEEDEAAALAEWGGQFRSDVESFVSTEAVQACVIPDRHELPARPGISYSAFVDPSGGVRDAMTLAIAHVEHRRLNEGEQPVRRYVADVARAFKPPFSPEAVVRQMADILERYDISRAVGDRYGGEWPRERFSENGIFYQIAEMTKGQAYLNFLPILHERIVELPDDPQITRELLNLERRTGRSGRDSVDHPPNAHDDLINAVAGVVSLLEWQRRNWGMTEIEIEGF